MVLPYVVFHYAIWHYTEAVRELITIWSNLIWFIWNFFSLPLLLRTLFSPWKRIHESAGGGLNLEAIGGALVVNFMMRLIGAGIRLVLVVVGILTIAIFFATAIASIIVWLLVPLLIPALISIGVTLFML